MMDPTDVHTKQYNNNNNKKIIICQHNIAWRQISSTLSRHWCLMKNLLILPVEIVKNMKRPDSIENRMYILLLLFFFIMHIALNIIIILACVGVDEKLHHHNLFIHSIYSFILATEYS